MNVGANWSLVMSPVLLIFIMLSLYVVRGIGSVIIISN